MIYFKDRGETMSLNRSELREKAMVILYQVDILKNNNVEFSVENLIEENLVQNFLSLQVKNMIITVNLMLDLYFRTIACLKI